MSELSEDRVIGYLKECGVPVGDDCFIKELVDGQVELVSVDAFVEGVHFLRDKMGPEEVGRRAVWVALSDLNAMGCGVEGAEVYVSVALAKDLDWRYVEGVFSGMCGVCEEYGVHYRGGDTCGSVGGVFISVTVVGRMKSNEVLHRSGAKAGMRILVERGGELRRGDLRAEGVVSAMDLSDGIYRDLARMCEVSGVGAEVDLGKVGVFYGMDGEEAVVIGEAYGLMLGVEEGVELEGFVEIGKFVEGSGVRYFKDGDVYVIKKEAYEHFKR